MAADADIVNFALTILGENGIVALTDDVKPAREANKIYAITRNSLLSGYNWSFAMTRTTLAADVTPPAYDFALAYTLPADCVRVVLVNEIYAGLDLTDYRGSPVEDFTLEGGKILTNYSSPIKLRYVKRITDPSKFTDSFYTAFGAKLAWELAETLTQSDAKQARAESRFHHEIANAIRSNAIELPPKKLADDEWVMSRL